MTVRMNRFTPLQKVQANMGRWLLVGSVLLSACSPTIRLYNDLCDGLDSDQDGAVDEGTGESIGCFPNQICVAGMCDYVCGDGRCQESCGSCPADCGECPFCGDGVCAAEDGEDCESCSDDCGACPSCGDGACNGAESCWSCNTDCGLCAGECESCGAEGACPAGMDCYFVPCTGTLTCGRPEGSPCTTWSGASCGRVPVYGRCTDDAQCGAPLTCVEGHCTRQVFGLEPSTCASATCPYPPPEPPGLGVTARCDHWGAAGREAYVCTMHCGDGGLCPYGMTCTGGLCI